MSDMTVERASITARDLSRRAGQVLDRVEHGERLVVTRDGEPIAEIIPIERSQRLLARWIRDGIIAPPPEQGYATAADVSTAARRSLPAPTSQDATEALKRMREDERT
jgi:prevent-host-death family protein